MRNALKTLLFLSAFSPALLSIAISRTVNDGYGPEALFYALAGFAGIACGYLILEASLRFGELIPFKAKKIESTDSALLAVVVSYIIPFYSKASDITVATILTLLAIGGVVFWFTGAVIPHPVLRLFKFRFYKVESEAGVVYTLIAKRDLLTPNAVKSVRKISNSMLMEA